MIVTGRPVADLKPFLQPFDNLEIWGAHGLERLLPDGTYQQTQTASGTREMLSQAEAWVVESNLARLAEFKPGGIAIHWRGMAGSGGKGSGGAATGRLDCARQQRRSEAPKLRIGSGAASRPSRQRRCRRSIIDESIAETEIAYLGDDLTDEDSFRALERSRADCTRSSRASCRQRQRCGSSRRLNWSASSSNGWTECRA